MLYREYLTAHFARGGDRVIALLSLTLDSRPETVWAALTEPDRLAQWLAPGRIELRLGGAARLDFGDSGVVVDSRVTALQPQRLLEYSWSGPGDRLRPVRWSLESIGAQTRLELQLTLPAGEDVARAVAGWSAHLEMLAAVLAGAAVRFPLPTFHAARAAYSEQLETLEHQRAASVG